MLLQPHSKRILREAIRSDADFLARSNIMDYSYAAFLRGVSVCSAYLLIQAFAWYR